jgi:protein-L-isoaspartate(D-aspartate) O-methyltransferase
MVEIQLRGRDITDERVLEAMLQVPREAFVPDAQQDEAYDDWPLPIGFGQTISQPYTVAFMLQALGLQGTENALEIGTGSGYAAAVLSHLARTVHTIERIPELARQAQARLQSLGYDNVQVHTADGSLGLPQQAPFDAIVVTAGAKSLPESLREQLADGGRIVIPIGQSISQTLYRFTRRGDQWQQENLGGFAFVPLIGQQGAESSD